MARRERLPESPPVTLLHSKRGFVAVPPSIFKRAAARRRLPARVRRAASIPRRRTRRVRERKYDRQQHQRKGPGSSQSQFACCLTDPGIDEDHGVDHDGDAGGEAGGLVGRLRRARQRRRSSDDGGSAHRVGDRFRRELHRSTRAPPHCSFASLEEEGAMVLWICF